MAVVIGPIGDVFADVIVERQLAAFREQQDAQGRELLRDRRGAQYARSGNPHA